MQMNQDYEYSIMIFLMEHGGNFSPPFNVKNYM